MPNPKSAALTTSLVNGLLGDPAVYAFFQAAGAGLLFDLGDLHALPTRDLLRVRMVLVSHAHLDHFIGFDRLLRVNIPHQRRLELVGPPGMIANVQGKLRGYLWNLIGPDHVQCVVHELAAGGAVQSALLRNQHGFAAEPWMPALPGEAVDLPPMVAPGASFAAPFAGLRLDAIALDHKTPSLAFACQLARRLHVRSEVLDEEGLEPGPWIRELQLAYSQKAYAQICRVADRSFRVGELGDRLFSNVAPRPFAYVTDIGFTRANLTRLAPLLAGVEHLICEANYQDAAYAKAIDRMHLTTKQAALLAASCGVGRLQIFHVSNLYADDAAASEREAADYFTRFSALTAAALAQEVADELARLAPAAATSPAG